jgi:hypothetical protein
LERGIEGTGAEPNKYMQHFILQNEILQLRKVRTDAICQKPLRQLTSSFLGTCALESFAFIDLFFSDYDSLTAIMVPEAQAEIDWLSNSGS